VRAAVEAWARELAGRPEVCRVVWYGSFVTGTPTPRSDADLCVVVRDEPGVDTPGGGRHARAAAYLPARATPVPFDVSVLTAREFGGLGAWAPAWQAAIARGRVLLER
jgi:predicted nucleotidyltransferase